MTTITIDKDNALDQFQKLMKLVSSWKRLEIKVQKSKKLDIESSLNNAIKEYEKWEFITLFEVK